MVMKKEGIIAIVLLTIIFSSLFVSANIFTDFWGKITGNDIQTNSQTCLVDISTCSVNKYLSEEELQEMKEKYPNVMKGYYKYSDSGQVSCMVNINGVVEEWTATCARIYSDVPGACYDSDFGKIFTDNKQYLSEKGYVTINGEKVEEYCDSSGNLVELICIPYKDYFRRYSMGYPTEEEKEQCNEIAGCLQEVKVPCECEDGACINLELDEGEKEEEKVPCLVDVSTCSESKYLNAKELQEMKEKYPNVMKGYYKYSEYRDGGQVSCMVNTNGVVEEWTATCARIYSDVPGACYDSDFGKISTDNNQYLLEKGYVTVNGKKVEEYCDSSGNLVEFICIPYKGYFRGFSLGEEKKQCNEIAGCLQEVKVPCECENGACKSLEFDEEENEQSTNCPSLGFRQNGNYCALDGKYKSQIKEDSPCDNSFECESNICASGKCVDSNLFEKILLWFKNLFGVKK